MTRAAERLHVVQSAVSQAVKRLERELDLPLLERRREGVRPTEAGAALAEHAQVIMNGVSRADRDMAAYRNLEQGHVRIGLLHTATPLVLGPLLQRLRTVHPGLRLEFHEGMAAELVELIQLGQLDLLVVLSPVDAGGLRLDPLARPRLTAVLPPRHRLASRRRVRLRELAKETWVSFPRANPGRSWLEDGCRAAGFAPARVVEVETLAHLKTFVTAGEGVALLPAGVAEPEGATGALVVLDLLPSSTVVLACATDPHQPQGRSVAAVRCLLEDVAGTHRSGRAVRTP